MRYQITRYFMPGRLIAIVGLAMLFAAPVLAAQAPQRVSFTLKEFVMIPSEVTVTQGQPVQFTVTNTGTVPHNFVVEYAAGGIEQKLFGANLMPGESRTAEYTFPSAGDWEMYCPVDAHEDHGMKGEIKVLAAAPSGMPSTGGGSLAPSSSLLLALLGICVLASGIILRRQHQDR